MTTYVVDAVVDAVLATVRGPKGWLLVGRLDFASETEAGDLGTLSSLLSGFSDAIWHRYESRTDDDSPNWRAAIDRALATPEPRLAYNDPAADAANSVGVLIADWPVEGREAVAAEMEAEMCAVEEAESGKFEGRAAQALHRSRSDASPLQVAAALDIIASDPLGCHQELATRVEPVAACVALVACLYEAAESVMNASDLLDIIEDADGVSRMPIPTIQALSALLREGMSYRQAVQQVIKHASDIALGWLPDRNLVAPGLDTDALRLTPLLPSAPATDLRHDLIDAMHGMFGEYLNSGKFDYLWSEDEDDETNEAVVVARGMFRDAMNTLVIRAIDAAAL